jgi:hypothetical protein
MKLPDLKSVIGKIVTIMILVILVAISLVFFALAIHGIGVGDCHGWDR